MEPTPPCTRLATLLITKIFPTMKSAKMFVDLVADEPKLANRYRLTEA
jgi:hypothetical protein